MLTPQEVSTHSFSKAHLGGYNMAMVDEFLDTLTEDYTTLYKENAALKAKLKVLADKVEEYRATEDSMRATLLTAQRMARKMVDEAEAEKTELLKKFESDALERKKQLDLQIAEETERLRVARAESAEFLTNMRRLCNSELEFLNGVPSLPVAAPVVSESEAQKQVESIEASVMSSFAKETAAETEDAQPASAEEPAADMADEPVPADILPAKEPEPEQTPEPEPDEEPEDLSATRRIDFGDLKFGRNYKQHS